MTAANSMEEKNAVTLRHDSPTAQDGTVVLHVEPLSAGVLTITKAF